MESKFAVFIPRFISVFKLVETSKLLFIYFWDFEIMFSKENYKSNINLASRNKLPKENKYI